MISIHALLAESDRHHSLNLPSSPIISIHALLAESDFNSFSLNINGPLFLSTLSLRRATRIRPERKLPMRISIHALLAESDTRGEHHANSQQEFLSTLSLRRATWADTTYNLSDIISIHALLAESDSMLTSLFCGCFDFYPRSPCGERLTIRL